MMKTQIFKLFAVAVFALLGTNNSMAQGLYYPGQVIYGNGFTYVCETPWMEKEATYIVFPGDVRLRNINNVFAGVAERDNGVLVPYIGAPNTFISDGEAFKKFHNIINSVFSVIDKQVARESSLFVDVQINSSTGRIVGVEFRMDIKSGFAKIAAEKYYRIETMLKEQVIYVINFRGKQYNFNHDSWPYQGGFFGQIIP